MSRCDVAGCDRRAVDYVRVGSRLAAVCPMHRTESPHMLRLGR